MSSFDLLSNVVFAFQEGSATFRVFGLYIYLGLSINGLVTDGNTKLCCRGYILALFQSITANKIDSNLHKIIRGDSRYAKLKYYELQ